MWDPLITPVRDQLPLWLCLLPVVGVCVVWAVHFLGARAVRQALSLNLWTAVALCVWMIVTYEPQKLQRQQDAAVLMGPIDRFQFRSQVEWLGETRQHTLTRVRQDGRRLEFNVPIRWGPDIRLSVGVDGLSLWFAVLSVVLVAIGALRDAESMTVRGACAWLWLQASLVGTFVALDVVLFVVCWLSTLVATSCLLSRGGDSTRAAAARNWLKAGALGVWFAALGLCGLVLVFGWLGETARRPDAPLIFATPELIAGIGHWTVAGDAVYLWSHVSPWLFCLLAAGFTWPMLLTPFHRGFVETLTSAPAGLAIVLSGVSIKVGLYGWLRFVLPVFPDIVQQNSGWLVTLVGLSGLASAILALGQTDWRCRVAFATSSSLALSLMGVLSQTVSGLVGGMLRILAQGITVALIVWILPERGCERHVSSSDSTDRLLDTVAQRRREVVLRWACLAWIGMPGLSGFVAELITPFGLIQNDVQAVGLSLAISGLIAWMWVRADRDDPMLSNAPWTPRDWIVIVFLLAVNVALGVVPQYVVDRMQPSLVMLLPQRAGMAE